MKTNDVSADALPADAAAPAQVGPAEILARADRTFARYPIALSRVGGDPDRYERDVCLLGPVVGVIPVDLARRELILLRQFRLAGHLATGQGDMVEIVAGRVEAGEKPLQAARRECVEEIGLAPERLVELFAYMPAPGVTDEIMTLFLARVDARDLPERAGLAQEHESIEPLRVPLDHVPAMLRGNAVRSGPLVLSLHWLALNGARLNEMLSN